MPTPKDAVYGELAGAGEGVVGVKSGSEVIRLYPGALKAFQRLISGEYGPDIRVAVASSADTPTAVKIGRAAMGVLEVLPGIVQLQGLWCLN